MKKKSPRGLWYPIDDLGSEVAPIMQPSLSVIEDERVVRPVLLDAQGRPVYRPKARIGFDI